MASEKKESNRLATVKWSDTGKLVADFGGGLTEAFNPALVHHAQHLNAEQYGWGVRFQRLGSLEVAEFPSVQSRKEEYRRRWRELTEHLYSGSDQWDMPKKGGLGPRVTQEDVCEALTRAFPQWDGTKVFEKKMAELKGDKTPELAVIETVKYWLSTKQVSAAWAAIQSERKAKAAESFLDVDDEVARMMAGE